ncbi:MAG: redoxin domain-containing protein [Planctomycetota bacterium]
MKLLPRLAAFTPALLLSLAAVAAAQTAPVPAPVPAEPAALIVGNPAPPLADVTWVKGQGPANWVAGQVYVLDFWATWCGPCRASIPHINELSKKYRDQGVNVIGPAIWPRKSMVPTAQFVTEKGDAMDYLIAEDVDGKTAATFMTSTLSNGIPTAMIIDRAGKLAWLGHPMSIDEPLAQVVAGTHDLMAAAAVDLERREKLLVEQKLQKIGGPIIKRAQEAKKAGVWPELLTASNELLELMPHNPDFAIWKYEALVKTGEKPAAVAFASSYVRGPAFARVNELNYFAWWMVDPTRVIPDAERDLESALVAAKRANELTESKNAAILDTLARVHFLRAEFALAISTQQQAVELADEKSRAELQATLDSYIAAGESG